MLVVDYMNIITKEEYLFLKYNIRITTIPVSV